MVLADMEIEEVDMVYFFFSLNIFNISSHSLVACKVSVEKLPNSLWGFP